VDDSVSKEKDVVSSDEEEKLRSKKAKRARRRSPPTSPTPLPVETASKPVRKTANKPPSETPVKQPPRTRATSQRDPPKKNDAGTLKGTAKPRANLQRNPSILGGELLNPQPHLSPATHRMSISSEESARNSPESPVAYKSLRRVKATSFARPMARRISFNNLVTAQEENCEPYGAGLGLGSAFQLR